MDQLAGIAYWNEVKVLSLNLFFLLTLKKMELLILVVAVVHCFGGLAVSGEGKTTLKYFIKSRNRPFLFMKARI